MTYTTQVGQPGNGAAVTPPLVLVAPGYMYSLSKAEPEVEREAKRAGAIAGAAARQEGWIAAERKTDLPGMPGWRHLRFTVLDFEPLSEHCELISVKTGSHPTIPDYWTYGPTFPVVSARLKALLQDVWPEGSYFLPCPLPERQSDIRKPGGPLKGDAPQKFFYWVIRNRLMFAAPEDWVKPKLLPPSPTTNPMFEMAANPAVRLYIATLPFSCFQPNQVLLQRSVYDRIRAAGMTGFAEMRGPTIDRGENVAHI